MMRFRHTAERDDQGFTVVELLIVVVVMGTLVSTLAAALVLSLRTAPRAEDRLDDARSTRALATWLSYDTTSAPPFLPEQAQGGIDLTSAANDCGGAGTNLLHLQWTESSFTRRTYVANYRFLDSGEIVRYYCSQKEGDAAFVSLSAQTLTRGLDPADPPTVSVRTVIETVTVDPGPPTWTLTTTTTDATAAGLTTSTTSATGSTEVVAKAGAATVSFFLNGVSGEQVLVETSSRNPSSFFPSP